jgi:MFS transporter, DHA2 family, multidrug resistance protein
LQAGDTAAASAIGLPPSLVTQRAAGPIDAATVAYLKPLVEKAALVASANEAWILLSAFSLIGLAGMTLLARKPVQR